MRACRQAFGCGGGRWRPVCGAAGVFVVFLGQRPQALLLATEYFPTKSNSFLRFFFCVYRRNQTSLG